LFSHKKYLNKLKIENKRMFLPNICGVNFDIVKWDLWKN